MLKKLLSQTNKKLLQNESKKGVVFKYLSHSALLRKQTTDDGTVQAEAEPTILVEKDDNITLIGINRERSRNSIDAATATKLSEAIYQFESDDSSPVGVLYGVGGSFCAGYDLTELETEAERGSLDFLMRLEGSVGPTRRHLRKPIVCAISGYCVASGLELALLCDLRVMEENALLGFFNRRLGVPLSDGGTVRLAAAVGLSHAVDIIETGRRVDAREALKIGLINRSVATGTALGQAVNLAFSIAKFPMAALMHDRNALYANANFYERHGFLAAMNNEIMNVSSEMITEMQEGVRRFKSSDKKGAKTNSWNIREKPIPDWEKAEIALEELHKKNKEQ